jgi:hypothetical protein
LRPRWRGSCCAVRRGQAEAIPEQPHEVDLPPSGDGPDGFDLQGRGRTGVGGVTEDGTVGCGHFGTLGHGWNASDHGAADIDSDLATLVRTGIIAVLFLHERPSIRDWLGILMVGGGVLVLALKR